MPEWKILITDGLQENGKEILEAAALVDDRNGISSAELFDVAADYDAFIIRSRTKVTSKVLNSTARLKVIGRPGVGVDNVDLETARRRGITVVNTPAASSQSVAELTMGMLFALARSIPTANHSLKAGDWDKKQLTGIELKGKNLGVIGVGNIGSLVARYASCMGMNVLACDKCKPDDQIESSGASTANLDRIFTHSDFITFHIPLNEETRGMIDGDAFKKMKRGVFLVNTARGKIFDEAALQDALDAGRVAGAALDVFSAEPPGTSPLVTHPNVIVTPHIGANTIEAQSRIARDIATEVLAALRGEPLRWKII